MRILVVTQYYWPEVFLVNDLCESLVKMGHKVVVYTGQPNYPHGEIFKAYRGFKNLNETHNGVEIIRVPLVPRGKSGALRLLLNYLSFAISASMLAPFRVREHYDLVLAYQLSPVTLVIPAVVLKYIKKVKLVLWIQDLWPESLSATGSIKSTKILGIVRALVRFLYRQSDIILIQSEAFRQSILNVAPDFPTQNIRYAPNWAIGGFAPQLSRTMRADQDSGLTIMFAGNIGKAQDFPTILSAAARLRENKKIKWLIVGDGREAAWVQRQIITLKLQDCMKMLGRHPIEKMPEFFSQADCMLVTLSRDPIFSITIPSKIQAYMACGKPIITALDGEGSRVVQEAGAGFCGPSGDIEKLVDNVKNMLCAGQETIWKMGVASRKYYESHFDRDKVIGDVNILIEGLA